MAEAEQQVYKKPWYGAAALDEKISDNYMRQSQTRAFIQRKKRYFFTSGVLPVR